MSAPFYYNLTHSREEKIKAFFNCKTPRDITDVLEFTYSKYFYYRFHQKSIYSKFDIPKKDGSFREIWAPNGGLKEIQRRLNAILQVAIKQKNCNHGFIKGRSIVTNAKIHRNRKYVLNFDLADFFPSIHFGRVKGLFESAPFKFNSETSSFLANLSCFNGRLPQGAPTSPIISTLISRKLDNELMALCLRNKCNYSRYADDITISTFVKELPTEIGKIDAPGKIELSSAIKESVISNGFAINSGKTRLSLRFQSQTVTGLKVNKIVNVHRSVVREARGMLNALDKYGPEKAQAQLNSHYNNGTRPKNFIQTLRGKLGFIGMVKGFENSVYIGLIAKANSIDSTIKLSSQILKSPKNHPIVLTEGKTDWKHLKKALKQLKLLGQFETLTVNFKEWTDGAQINNTELMKICESLSKLDTQKATMIFLFDNDRPEITKKALSEDLPYKYWGNNIYSTVLPQSRAFPAVNEVCIEHFYNENDLKIEDENGRRLYLSNEFNKKDKLHLTIPGLRCESDKIKSQELAIIDNSVFNELDKNVALSKNDFAKSILGGKKNFENVNFDAFESIFSRIGDIILYHRLAQNN